jgi:hypothetical protein
MRVSPNWYGICLPSRNVAGSSPATRSTTAGHVFELSFYNYKENNMNTTVDVNTLLTAPQKQFKYYGANCNQFKLGSRVYEAIEDPDDGYRSCMRELVLVDKPQGIFSRQAIATVFVREQNYLYEIVDVKDGYVWLTFGTDSYDDYYPCFHFEPHPKAP